MRRILKILICYQVFIEPAFTPSANSTSFLLQRISVLSPGLSCQPALPCVCHASQCGGSIKEAAQWTAEAGKRERNIERKLDAHLRNLDAELTVESEPPTDSHGHH